MIKTDKSKHNICIAAIKRSTIKPYDFKWTKFYESNAEFSYSGLKLDLTENELIICSTVIEAENYSILTTQKLITVKDGVENIGNLINAEDNEYGNFKSQKEAFTFGSITLQNASNLEYFIETGNASMVMIHGVRTLLKTQELTVQNIENLTRVWNRKNRQNDK